MNDGDIEYPEHPAADKILRLVADLCPPEVSGTLTHHVRQILAVEAERQHERERLYAGFVSLLLDALITHLGDDDELVVEVWAVQSRLLPPLSEAELYALRRQVEGVADRVTQRESLARERIEAMIAPLRQRLTAIPERASATSDGPAGRMAEAIQLATARLAVALEEAVSQGEEFATFLEAEMGTLERVGEGEPLSAHQLALRRELEKIHRGQRRLNQHFDQIRTYLTQLEADREHFTAELSRMIELSLTDELTGLPNRRAFMQRLQDEVARAHRYGTPLVLAIVDIDRFKPINDRYGHAAGDAVLREYARHVLSAFRHHDLVARYGGEEFAVLFPGTPPKGVRHALEKARARIQGHEVEVGDRRLPLPTFSAGIAMLRSGENGQDLIRRADQALYRAKHAGRDRIVDAEKDVSQPSG